MQACGKGQWYQWVNSVRRISDLESQAVATRTVRKPERQTEKEADH